MKKLMYLLFAASFIGLAIINPAAADSGNLPLLGNSARSLGMGGATVSETGSDLFYQNPAAIGPLERIELNLGYSSPGGDIRYPSLCGVLPTSYGNMGLCLGYFSLPDGDDKFSAAYFTLGNARELSRSLTVGASLGMVYGSADSADFFRLGASLGAIYTIGFSTRDHRGFGIFDPALGGSIHIGLPSWLDHEKVNSDRATLGYSFLFYRDPRVFLKFRNEISAIDNFGKYPVKFGIESTFLGSYILRGGFMVPPEYGLCAYTLGAGTRLSLGESELRVDYGLGYHPDADFIHTMGVTYLHGSLDRDAPSAAVEVSEKFISPNYDGVQDFALFSISVSDRSRIKGWKLRILDSDGNEIREYRLSDREIEPGGLLRRLWTRKENLVVPRRVLWDGTDARGSIVPDGAYSWSFLVWDERDNIAPAISGTVRVDNTPPVVELKADNLLFSPNGDGKKDILTIKQTVSSTADDRWTAGFRFADGRVIKSYSWNGDEVPSALNWNGKDDRGADAPEGLYRYFIESRDRSGNASARELAGISLTRQYETADINSSSEYLSTARGEKINFFLSLSKTDGLESWKIVIVNNDRKPVTEIPGDGPFQRLVAWDGRDAAGKLLKDGVYYYSLHTVFANGNTPSSFEKRLIVDGTPPSVKLRTSPTPFSPDGDGEDDLLTIHTEADDNFGIRSWNLLIFGPSKEVFKSFSGLGSPAPEIMWDGVNGMGELVESAVDYRLELTVTDMAGNTSARSARLPIDVLVLVTERGLKIRISNIEFAFDSAKLTPRAFPVLNRVADILKKYAAYHVLVEGHTDDIGEEEYNLTLSEGRARAVRDYLIGRGIAAERLEFRGMGETAPFMPNTSAENRRRNRRVEFILIRKDSL
ncbi:MAG TPA: OmpA family protein [Spirochaetes bacterium]|nr:OmpA family protein [Spirochaetota bacterium]